MLDRHLAPSRPRRARATTVGTLLAATAVLMLAGSAGATGMVGELGADFNLQASTGEWHMLSDYNDEIVMLFMVGYG